MDASVVLPGVHSRVEVEEIAHRLQSVFDEPFSLERHNLQGSASVGLALYPDDGHDKDTLLSTADAAMYMNKQADRALKRSCDGMKYHLETHSRAA